MRLAIHGAGYTMAFANVTLAGGTPHYFINPDNFIRPTLTQHGTCGTEPPCPSRGVIAGPFHVGFAKFLPTVCAGHRAGGTDLMVRCGTGAAVDRTVRCATSVAMPRIHGADGMTLSRAECHAVCAA